MKRDGKHIIEDRIVELTFQIYHGDYSELVKLLDTSGIEYTKSGNTYNIDGRVRTAIYNGLESILTCCQRKREADLKRI